MASDQDALSSYQPSEQLARLRSWCRQSAPAFYADQAHYLRVLRDCLPDAVHRALAEWLCALDLGRFNQLSDQDRLNLQERIDQLVQRCCALLTIEQLQLLARNLEKERQYRRRRAQKTMVEALQRSPEPDEGEEAEALSGPGDLNDLQQSVQLSFDPPIDHPSLLDGLLPLTDVALEQNPEGGVEGDSAHNADVGTDSDVSLSFEQPPEGSDEDPMAASLSEQGSTDLSVLRSLFVMAGQAMGAQDPEDGSEDLEAEFDHGSETSDLSAEQSFMPNMPLELLRWLDGMDQAMLRRLRNLSHAINVELLRAGLASSLVPTSLLDAVISGQVETLPAASNLVRLRVPLPMPSPGESLIDLSCVLLRPSELEFDRVSLRRCRSKLRQRQRNLLTMVRQQRHWQRRAQTQQVQQQWWPSPPTSPPQP
ncbi:MAG: hypothetical protein VKK03_08670 [Synechococcus sp.]|nr:hypothetical protein [Synechococcus sp.]